MNRIPKDVDRLGVVFDDGSLVADAGLLVAGALMSRLGLERLLDETVRLGDRVGGACPGRKVLSLVASMLVGGSHIDHADRLRAGSTDRALPFRVMAPSTLGTFLRSFTWGHVRQMDKALGETLRRVWSVSGGPDRNPVTVDVDSTVCEVSAKTKHGAAYGYTRQLGYHPLAAVRSETAPIVRSRLRGGSSHRGNAHFVTETVNRVRRAGALGPVTIRAEELRWKQGRFVGLIVRCGLRCGRLVVRRWGGVSIGSGSGKGSPVGCQANKPGWRLVCRLRLVRVGSATMAGWPHFLWSPFRDAICPLSSEKRSRFSTPASVGCVRSPANWAVHRRRSHASCAATPQPVVEAWSIGPRPRNGIRIGAPAARKSPSWPRTTSCANTSKIVSAVLSPARTANWRQAPR